MNTPTVHLELTQAELHLLENALRSFGSNFGHDEADVLDGIRMLLAKVYAADPEDAATPGAPARS